jgi:hypothetical protein
MLDGVAHISHLYRCMYEVKLLINSIQYICTKIIVVAPIQFIKEFKFIFIAAFV